MRTLQRLTVAAAFATLAACGNAGSDLGVGITATGSVIGAVYFDANGSGTRDAGDTPMAGVRVAVVAQWAQASAALRMRETKVGPRRESMVWPLN